MDEWLRWAIGILLPALLAHGTWITVHMFRLTTHVFGTRGDNGLRGDVLDLKKWREEFRATLPQQFKQERHDLTNKFSGEMLERLADVYSEMQRMEQRLMREIERR